MNRNEWKERNELSGRFVGMMQFSKIIKSWRDSFMTDNLVLVNGTFLLNSTGSL
jgi:hypothetical protein